jgi:phosphoribosyl 1,2-cyclic phosphodiesterase
VQVQFWGTRGSIPKPGPTTIRYGGNTLCHEIRTARGTLVIIDCGTGLHGLGLKLLSGGRGLAGHILISHTHWDHIQGVPFFDRYVTLGLPLVSYWFFQLEFNRVREDQPYLQPVAA